MISTDVGSLEFRVNDLRAWPSGQHQTKLKRPLLLNVPVSTVADIANDPQLEARGFFQSVAGSRERFCGSFAVIDGERPALRHAPGEPVAFAPPRRRAGGPG